MINLEWEMANPPKNGICSGKSHGQRSLATVHRATELDTTEHESTRGKCPPMWRHRLCFLRSNNRFSQATVYKSKFQGSEKIFLKIIFCYNYSSLMTRRGSRFSLFLSPCSLILQPHIRQGPWLVLHTLS